MQTKSKEKYCLPNRQSTIPEEIEGCRLLLLQHWLAHDEEQVSRVANRNSEYRIENNNKRNASTWATIRSLVHQLVVRPDLGKKNCDRRDATLLPNLTK